MNRNFYKALFLVGILFCVAGCGQTAPEKPSTDKAFLQLTDDSGRQVILKQAPRRIVVLSPSFLELLYAVGGQAVGRPSTTVTLDAPMAELPEIGFVYNISTEKLLSLQPDLIIGMEGMHEKLVPLLESNHIPFLLLKYKTYDDIYAKVALFGEIAGTKEQAAALEKSMKQQLEKIQAQIPAQKKKIAILHATSKSVTLELDNSIAGNTARFLRLENVAESGAALDKKSSVVPYSLEKLVQGDPDLIFVVTMGHEREVQDTLRKNVESNPAWSALRAVRERRVYFLPANLFLVNPGIHLPEAVLHMAKLAYPHEYDQ